MRDKNGAMSYPTDAVPEKCVVTSAERSAVALYKFCSEPPRTYIAYVQSDLSAGSEPSSFSIGHFPINLSYSSTSNDWYSSTCFSVRATVSPSIDRERLKLGNCLPSDSSLLRVSSPSPFVSFF